MKAASNKKSRSYSSPSEKPRKALHPSSPSRASPPPTDVPATTPSKRKHHDPPLPSPTSKKKSLSEAPPSKKHRRSPLPSSPSRAPPTPPSDVPATSPSKRKPRAGTHPSPSSNNPGRASFPPPSLSPTRKPTPTSAKAETVAPPHIPPPSDDRHDEKSGIPKLFQRIWKMDDEITLLKGLLQCKKRSGKEPASSEDFDALHEFVRDSIDPKISRDQMMTKRLSMRRKYKRKMAKLQTGTKPSGDEHEQRCLELARLLWGEEFLNDYNDRKGKALTEGKPKEAPQKMVADDSDDVLVRLVEEACFPKGVLVKKRTMNFKPEKLTTVKEGYISELQMEKELKEQLANLEAQIIQAMTAVREKDDFCSSDDEDGDASNS